MSYIVLYDVRQDRLCLKILRNNFYYTILNYIPLNDNADGNPQKRNIYYPYICILV